MPELFGLPEAAPLSITALVINLVIGVFLSLVLRWHFERYGTTLSNRQQFSQVFTFIVLTTTLIITIVKSSLALSLGLVGALSIVRFRTPIKEPEELAYLFMAIAMGLGLGADQTIPTVIAIGLILTVMAVIKHRKPQSSRNLYLSLHWVEGAGTAGKLDELNRTIGDYVQDSDLRRFDSHQTGGEAVYYIDVENSDRLSALMGSLKEKYPEMDVTFIDQNNVPSV